MKNIDIPSVKFEYDESGSFYDVKGAQIPVFIGFSNSVVGELEITKHMSYSDAFETYAAEDEDIENPQSRFLQEVKNFFEENDYSFYFYDTCKAVYIIDLGQVESFDADLMSRAVELAKSVYEIEVEVYLFEKDSKQEKVIEFLNNAVLLAKNYAIHGRPRELYFTVYDASDKELMSYTKSNSKTSIQSSWLGLIRPELVGKVVNMLCRVASHEEPGYYAFKSVSEGKYIVSSEKARELQNSGIIFIRDEFSHMTRINLAVSTAYASSNPPADALLHHRRNVNQFVRELYPLLFAQLKKNETKSTIAFLKSDIDVLVDQYMQDEKMQKETKIEIFELNSNPYVLGVKGLAFPVNSTQGIDFKMYINEPRTKGGV